MSIELIVRSGFGVLFFATLIAGYFLFKNFGKLLGPDPKNSGESAGARSLNQVQVIVIWLHILAITGGFALLLH